MLLVGTAKVSWYYVIHIYQVDHVSTVLLFPKRIYLIADKNFMIFAMIQCTVDPPTTSEL